MKANELMIGDWVMLTNRIHNGEKMQVKEIHGDGHITVDGAITKMFEPIPLTPEILEKNGFTFKKHTYFLKKDGHYWINEEGNIFIKYSKKSTDKIDSWRINVDNGNGYPVCCFDIFYVHELQHALKLCGIEKEIEI